MDSRIANLLFRGTIGRPVQRWAKVAGFAALLLPLPAVLWRLAMLVGIPTGFAYPELYRSSAEGVIYVVILELVQIGVAVLAFGLIRPWGECSPRWMPLLGGRIIHRLVPTVIGGIGAIALATMLGVVLAQFSAVASGAIEGWLPSDGMSRVEHAVLLAAYVPFFVWPIAIGVAVCGYWLRRAPGVDR